MTSLLLARSKQRARDSFNGAALQQQWAKTDTENKLTVNGGTLVCAGGKAVPAWDDPRLTWSMPLRPKAGLAFECEFTFTSFGASGMQWGFDSSSPVAVNLTGAFAVLAGGTLRVITAGGTSINVPVTLVVGASYRFRVVYLGTAGILWTYSADGGLTWVLLWHDATVVTATRYAGISNNSAAFTSQYLRVYQGSAPVPALSDTFAARTSPGRADTGQPWLNVPSRPTPTIAGDLRIPAGQTEAWLQAWDGIADGIWEADANFGSAPSTQKRVYLGLRWQSPTNYVVAAFNRQAQTITILRTVAGTQTTLGTLAAAGFTDATAYTFRVVAVGTTIKVYQGGVEKLSVTDPVHQYAGLCSVYLNDDLATPDIRVDNLKVWGTPTRPLLMDSFDRPDGAIGQADSGQAYTGFSDTTPFSATWGVESGRARMLSASASSDKGAAVALRSAASPLHGAAYSSGGASQGAGLIVRYQDPQNYLIVRLLYSNNTVLLTRNLAGTRTTVATSAVSALSQDVNADVAAVVIGNAIEVYVGGVRYLSTTATDFPNSPAAGPYVSSTNFVRVDDLRAYPPGAGALVHDTFTRADSAVSLGATELPGVAYAAIFSSVWGISTNQAYWVSGSAGAAIVPVLPQDIDVQCDLVRQGGVIGLIVRCDSVGNNYLLVQFDGTNVTVRERVGGAAPTTANNALYTWAVSATPKVVRLRTFQGLLSIYVDGVLLLAHPFTGHADAYCGLYTGATTNRFDSFSVKAVT